VRAVCCDVSGSNALAENSESYARRVRAVDYPWGTSPDAYAALMERMETDWGSAIDLSSRAPSLAHDKEFLRHFARYLRMSASPGTAIKYARMNGEIDVREMLPSIRVPTSLVPPSLRQNSVIDSGPSCWVRITLRFVPCWPAIAVLR
jgi:hypothetical protein